MTHDPAVREVEALEDNTFIGPEAATERAQKWLDRAPALVDPVLRQRVRLVLADGELRRGHPEIGAVVIREILAWTSAHAEPYVRARCHRLLAGWYGRAGDGARALEHAVLAVDVLPADVRGFVRADHLLSLADALGELGSFAQSLGRYDEAGQVAQAAGNDAQVVRVLNNLAFTHFQAGNAEEAVAAAERLLSVSERIGLEVDVYRRDTIARTYTMVGRYEDAVAILLPAVGPAASPSSSEVQDGVATAMLTLAEIQRVSGALDDADHTLDRVGEICRAHKLVGCAVDVLRERAEVYAARGIFEQALICFRQFHEAETKLRAVEREIRARTLQAIYEAEEARRQRERFREMSLRDALTGLGNRRYIDAQLDPALLHSANAAEPISAAILDLDHFKSINDLRSHAVGDEVLRQVGAILRRAADDRPGSIVARLGGEEFLFVLPGTGPGEAANVLGRLCQAVREHPWEPITTGVPVTVSIGVATAPGDGAERIPLLACADRRLFAAKDAGRNQVVADDAALQRASFS